MHDRHIKQHTNKQSEQNTIVWFDDGYLMFDTEKKQYVAVINAPPIVNLVLTAGGPRGLYYIGGLQAFEECKQSCISDQTLIEQVETVSGASIGAIFGAAIASGMHSDELKKAIIPVDFGEALGDGWTPSLPFTNARITILRDGKPLYELVRKNIVAGISARLRELYNITSFKAEHRVALIRKAQQLGPAHEKVITALLDELEKSAEGIAPVITFAMLHSLHCLHPKVFKELYVATVCQELEKSDVCYLSAETAPDLEIALAALASAAIPAIVKPVPIPKHYLSFLRDKPEVPDIVHMVDGGYLDASPYAAVEGKQKKEMGFNVGEYNQNLHTVILMPDDTKVKENQHHNKQAPLFNGAMQHQTQSPLLNYRELIPHELAPFSFIENWIYNVVPRWFCSIRSNVIYTKKLEANLRLIRRDFSQRVVAYNIKMEDETLITTLAFKEAKSHAAEIIERGRQTTSDYLKHHNSESMYYSYHSLTDLMKNLPEDKYLYLIRNRKQFRFFDGVDLETIARLREKHRQIPASLWPQYNLFLKTFYQMINEMHFKQSVVKVLQQHFDIISIDDRATDEVKMIRALSVIFDHYTDIQKMYGGEVLLTFFCNYFKKQINILNCRDVMREDLVFAQEMFSKEIQSEHYKEHHFHVVYQRIMFILQQTKSNIVNPEDDYKRKFIQTIANEIQDLAALHIDEKNKLKRLEEYVYESYYKVLYYKGTDRSNLVQALKHIITSPKLLNLPFYYGVQLQEHEHHLPQFKAYDANNRYLDRYHTSKLKCFLNYTTNMLNNAYIISKNHFTLSLFKQHQLSFAKFSSAKAATVYRATVKTMLVSPYEKDHYHAQRLNEFITPIDVRYDIDHSRSLFYASSLLTRLMWITAPLEERQLYKKLIDAVKQFISDYTVEDQCKDSFIETLKGFFDHLNKKDKQQSGFFTFFCGHSKLYSLLKNFIEIDLHMTIAENKAQAITLTV